MVYPGSYSYEYLRPVGAVYTVKNSEAGGSYLHRPALCLHRTGILAEGDPK